MSKVKSGYDSDGAVLSVGDHLRSPRLGYSHHGLYVGNDKVIHYSGFVDGMSAGEIEITSIDAFRNGNSFYIVPHPFRRYDGDESIDRAFSRLGEDWYNVLLNNCEHFVCWCINGLHSSSQVNMTVAMIAAAYQAQKATQAPELVLQALQGIRTVYQTQQTAEKAGKVLYAVQGVTSAMAAKSTSTTAAAVAASNLAGIAAGTATTAATTSLATSSVAGTVAGMAAGAAASSSAGLLGGATAAAAGLVGGTAAAPAVAVAGVAVAAGYGVKKVWDWLTD